MKKIEINLTFYREEKRIIVLIYFKLTILSKKKYWCNYKSNVLSALSNEKYL